MAALDKFNELPMKQRVGIIAGAGMALALFISYMLHSDLGRLGPDPDNLFGFMMREADGSLWQEIGTLTGEIDRLKQKAALLPRRQLELAEIKKAILVAREQLPAERERSKIGEEIGEFAVIVVKEGLGHVSVLGIDIKDNSAQNANPRARSASTGPQPQSITFICNLAVDVDGLIAFINKIERSNRFMTVDGIKIKPGKVTANTEKDTIAGLVYDYHNARLEINTWVLQE